MREHARLINMLRKKTAVMDEIGKRALTGLIGELVVCDKLGLNWEPQQGSDATDRKGNTYQIKSRRADGGGKVKGAGSIGTFHNLEFDYLLYAEFEGNYDLVGIWKLPVKLVERLDPLKDDLAVSAVRGHGERVYLKGY